MHPNTMIMSGSVQAEAHRAALLRAIQADRCDWVGRRARRLVARWRAFIRRERVRALVRRIGLLPR